MSKHLSYYVKEICWLKEAVVYPIVLTFEPGNASKLCAYHHPIFLINIDYKILAN